MERVQANIAVSRELVAVSSRMVDLSRRWLAAYRAKQEAALKACLVCGSKSSDMHPLALDSTSVVNFENQNPGIDMKEQLKEFAVCHDCAIRFQGQRHRVVFAIDPSLRRPTHPSRVLN